MSRYGFIEERECDFLDRIIDLLAERFQQVNFLEIGLYGGGTAAGIARRCRELDFPFTATGVDCLLKHKPDRNLFPELPADYDFRLGDSMDAWRGITKRCNWLFVDGCHCVNHSMCDFLNYSPFVVMGGYALFHDTAVPTNQFEQEPWPQDHSYAGKDPSKLGVREGLRKLGLLQGYRTDWKLIEEIPSGTGLMGMVLLQKLSEL